MSCHVIHVRKVKKRNIQAFHEEDRKDNLSFDCHHHHHHRPFVMSPAPEPAPAPSASPLLKSVSFVVVCLTEACFLLCIIQTPVQWFFVYNPLGLLPASLNHMAGVSQTKKETDYETVRTKDIYLPRNKNDGFSNNGLFLPGAE